jgi:Rrf2 family protein
MGVMRVSAKADYAVRACAELAASPHGDPVAADMLAAGQGLPVSFVERILGDLRRAGIVASVRGRSGGYRLARDADEVTLAEIIRAVDGPLVTVRDERPPSLAYEGSAAALLDVWVALRVSVRDVLDVVTIEELAQGDLPGPVKAMLQRADAWENP